MNSSAIGKPRARARKQAASQPFDQRATIQYAGQRIGLCTSFGIGERQPLFAQPVGHAQCDQHRGGDHRQRQTVVEQAGGIFGFGDAAG